MSVLSCQRYGCGSIMCDTYVDGVGYVCDECQEDFKKFIASKGIILSNEDDIIKYLKLFMETEKNEYITDDEIGMIDNFFEKNTEN